MSRVRGVARELPSICGHPATEWAYQHKSKNPLYDRDCRVYSDDPNDYEPMCQSCHDALDVGHGQRSREQLAEARKKINWWKVKVCDECGLSSSPAGLASHQRHTGHEGYTDLEVQP